MPIVIHTDDEDTMRLTRIVFAEFCGIFTIAFVLMGLILDKKAASEAYGLGYGMAVIMSMFAFGPTCGGSFNPARIIGPSVIIS